MSRPRLRVALLRGPRYDHRYDLLGDVEVVAHADHPTLNRAVAALVAAGERLDVISTHSTYAPSQAGWLRPLDDLVDPSAVAPLAPLAVDLCRFHGRAHCLPRLIDVRVLWARTDRLDVVPDTWDRRHDGLRLPRARVGSLRDVLRARGRCRRAALHRRRGAHDADRRGGGGARDRARQASPGRPAGPGAGRGGAEVPRAVGRGGAVDGTVTDMAKDVAVGSDDRHGASSSPGASAGVWSLRPSAPTNSVPRQEIPLLDRRPTTAVTGDGPHASGGTGRTTSSDVRGRWVP